jgi:hypothetical protein
MEVAVRDAVQRMAKEKRESPEDVTLAEQNTATLVARMVQEARTMQFTELHEPTLPAALSRLCPIRPFC